MSAEHLLLELEQLDHQAGQRLVGGGLSLDVLRRGQHGESQSWLRHVTVWIDVLYDGRV